MDALTSRYLSAFAKIEQRIASMADAGSYRTFFELLSEVAPVSPPVRYHEKTLREFANLRNVLVHRYDHKRELAIPNERTVAQLEGLVAMIVDPPRVDSMFAMQVETCGPEDSVQSAALKMVDGEFSQLPVVEGDRIIDLLTSETITRWMAAQLKRDGLLEAAPVKEVLTHKENKSTYTMLGRNATAFDALESFDQALHAGHTYDAILLTNNGKRSERLIGILTPFDIPRLLSTTRV